MTIAPVRARISLAALVALALLGCQRQSAPPDVPLGMTPDDRTLARFLAAFPSDEYTIHDVPGVGRFHLNHIDDAIKNVLRKGEPWEPHVLAMLPRLVRPGSTAVDAGAHIGTLTIPTARQIGAGGRVYAFEPQAKIYRELHQNLKLNGITNVVALRCALGDRAGVIEMDAADPANEGGTAIGSGGDRAELRTLDSFALSDVSLLKIDVELHEDEVLDGARQTILASHPAILIEIMGGHDLDTASDPIRARARGTMDRLEKLGYAVQRIGPWDYLALPR